MNSVILPAHAQTSPVEEEKEPAPGPDLSCSGTLAQNFCGGGNEITNITATVNENVPDGTEIVMTATLNGGALPSGAENPRTRTTTANVADFGDLNVCFPIHQAGLPQNSTITLLFEFADSSISEQTCTEVFNFNPPPEVTGDASFNGGSNVECGDTGNEITNITASTSPPIPGVTLTLDLEFDGGALPSGAPANRTAVTNASGVASFSDVNVCNASQDVTGQVTMTFGFQDSGVSTDTDVITVNVILE